MSKKIMPELVQYLLLKRTTTEDFLSTKDIRKGLNEIGDNGFRAETLWYALDRLYDLGFIEKNKAKTGMFRVFYRYKRGALALIEARLNGVSKTR